MILVYQIDVPILHGTVLFKHRELLQDRRRRSVKQSADLEVTAYLWKPYTPERYHHEGVKCARRVTLTGAAVFIYANTAAQVAVELWCWRSCSLWCQGGWAPTRRSRMPGCLGLPTSWYLRLCFRR